MKALVVHESLFGNTAEVAAAVAAGLAQGLEVEVAEVRVDLVVDEDVDLLVVGGPTHAFSMSRTQTRAEAVTKGAPAHPSTVGIREWLGALPISGRTRLVATFDTRVEKVRHLPGSAARKAAKVLSRRGYDAVLPPESFYVADLKGPLVDGETARARRWGEHLADVCERAPSPA
jgi:flavodoxin